MSKDLSKMSYPQFAAKVGNNTPPGAEDTVKWWIENGLINEKSSVLDLACCHGYSSFKIHELTNATIHGVDIDPYCIDHAKASISSQKVSFSVNNAEELDLGSNTFSHVVSGCSLGFVKNLKSAIDEAHRVLQVSGILGSSNFYYKNLPPESLLTDVEDVLGFIPNSNFEMTLKESCQEKFKLRKFENKSLIIFPQPALKQVVKAFVENQLRDSTASEQKEACERMYHIRSVLNDLRRFQYYRNEIWEKI